MQLPPRAERRLFAPGSIRGVTRVTFDQAAAVVVQRAAISLSQRRTVDDKSRLDGAVCDDSSLGNGSRILILSCMQRLVTRECPSDELPHGYRMLAPDYT
jgi:hypothetical protein